MSENDKFDRINEGDHSGDHNAGTDNLGGARNVDSSAVNQALRKNPNITRSMADFPGLPKSGSEFGIDMGDRVVTAKAKQLDSTPDAVARRDLEKLAPPGSHMKVDFQRVNGQLSYTVDGGTTQQNEHLRNQISQQGDAFWQHMDKATPPTGKHTFELGAKPNAPSEAVKTPTIPTDNQPHAQQYKAEVPHLDPSKPAADHPTAHKKTAEDVVKERLGQHMPEGTAVNISMKNGAPYISWHGAVSPHEQQELQKAMHDPELQKSLDQVAHKGLSFNSTHFNENPSQDTKEGVKVTYKQGEYLKAGANDNSLKADATKLSAGAYGAERPPEPIYWTGESTVQLGGRPVDIAIHTLDGTPRVRADLKSGSGAISEVSGILRADANGNRTYYIDQYVDKNVKQVAPSGQYFQSIPLYQTGSDGSSHY